MQLVETYSTQFSRTISGLIGIAVRTFDLRTEGYRFESRWRIFPFFHLFLIFMCNLFSTYFSILTPFFSSIDIFNRSKID
jgi:hypothetical protein